MSIYTTYALPPGGPEEIERYEGVAEAVEDTLLYWPEDDHDVEVRDDATGLVMARIEHGRTDPAFAHVSDGHGRVLAIYRCWYEADPRGRVAPVVTRILNRS